MQMKPFSLEWLIFVKKKIKGGIRIVVKTISGLFPLSFQDGIGDNLISCKIKPYLAQNGITVSGKLYKVANGVEILDSFTNNNISTILSSGIKPRKYTNFKVVAEFSQTISGVSRIGENNGYWFGGTANNTWTIGANITVGTRTGDIQHFEFTSIRDSASSGSGTIKLKVDGVESSGRNYAQYLATDGEYYLVNLNNFSGSAVSGVSKFYAIYGDGVLVGYFLPARKNNVVGVYDLISGQFIAPAVGTLTAGKTTKTVNVHSEIPSELYQEVKYLKSNGNGEHIDTGIIPVEGDDVSVDIYDFQTFQTTGKHLLGLTYYGEWSSSRGWYVGIAGSSGKNAWNCKATLIPDPTYNSLGIETGQSYKLSINDDGYYVDDVRKITLSNDTQTIGTGKSLWLFAVNTAATSAYNNGIWAYGVTDIKVNGTLEGRYVPVKRLSDDAYGMYDLVSDTFFGNDGTGSFTGGEPYQIEVPICSVERSGNKTPNMIDFNGETKTRSGITFTNNGDGSWTLNGTAVGLAYTQIFTFSVVNGHKYIIHGGISGDVCVALSIAGLWGGTNPTCYGDGAIGTARYDGTSYAELIAISGTVCDNVVLKPQLFDLTDMGIASQISTVADFKSWLVNKGYMRSISDPIPYIPYGKWEYDIDITHDGTTQTVKVFSEILQGSIDAVSGVETEEWDCHTFVATDRITKDGARYFYRPPSVKNVGPSRTIEVFSSHFMPSTSGATGSIFLFNREVYMYPNMSMCPDVESMLRFLVENDVTIWFPKETPTQSQGTTHSIESYTGLCTFDCKESKTGEITYNSRSVSV